MFGTATKCSDIFGSLQAAFIYILVLCFFCFSIACNTHCIESEIFDVLDFGAVANGTTDSSEVHFALSDIQFSMVCFKWKFNSYSLICRHFWRLGISHVKQKLKRFHWLFQETRRFCYIQSHSAVHARPKRSSFWYAKQPKKNDIYLFSWGVNFPAFFPVFLLIFNRYMEELCHRFHLKHGKDSIRADG